VSEKTFSKFEPVTQQDIEVINKKIKKIRSRRQMDYLPQFLRSV